MSWATPAVVTAFTTSPPPLLSSPPALNKLTKPPPPFSPIHLSLVSGNFLLPSHHIFNELSVIPLPNPLPSIHSFSSSNSHHHPPEPAPFLQQPCGKSNPRPLPESVPLTGEGIRGPMPAPMLTSPSSQWNLRLHQLPGGEGQEVHSRHSYQWYATRTPPLSMDGSFAGHPPPPAATLLTAHPLSRSLPPRVPWI